MLRGLAHLNVATLDHQNQRSPATAPAGVFDWTKIERLLILSAFPTVTSVRLSSPVPPFDAGRIPVKLEGVVANDVTLDPGVQEGAVDVEVE